MIDETSAPAELPAQIEPPRFVGKPRSKTVPLDYPIEFGGKVYDSVTVRRLTGTEVGEFAEACRRGDKAILPMYDCPFEVIEALDADDAAIVHEVTNDFLPLSLQTGSEQAPPLGDSTPA